MKRLTYIKNWITENISNNDYKIRTEITLLLENLHDTYHFVNNLNKTLLTERYNAENRKSNTITNILYFSMDTPTKVKTIDFMGLVYKFPEMAPSYTIMPSFPILSELTEKSDYINFSTKFGNITSLEIGDIKREINIKLPLSQVSINSFVSIDNEILISSHHRSAIKGRNNNTVDKKQVLKDLKELNNSLEQTTDFYRAFIKMVNEKATDLEIDSFIKKYKDYPAVFHVLSLVFSNEMWEKMIPKMSENSILFSSDAMMGFINVYKQYLQEIKKDENQSELLGFVKEKQKEIKKINFSLLDTTYFKQKLEGNLEKKDSPINVKRSKI